MHEHKFIELSVFQANTTVFQANTNASLKDLESQVRQLALNMQNQASDSFPSDTKKKIPKYYMFITLRSGKELQEIKEAEKKKIDDETENKYHNSTGSKKRQSINEFSNENQPLKKQSELQTEKTMQKEEVRAHLPPIPFRQRLNPSKLDNQYDKFLNMLKKLEINIPFAEALAQILHYAKFMKDIISKKKKLDDNGVVSLSTNCSATDRPKTRCVKMYAYVRKCTCSPK